MHWPAKQEFQLLSTEQLFGVGSWLRILGLSVLLPVRKYASAGLVLVALAGAGRTCRVWCLQASICMCACNISRL